MNLYSNRHGTKINIGLNALVYACRTNIYICVCDLVINLIEVINIK